MCRMCFKHRHTQEIPDLLYTAPFNGVVSHGAQIGVFGFLPTTHAKSNAIQMRPWSLRAVQPFTCVYLHAKAAVDAGDMRTWRTTVILITGKTWRPPIWAPCRNQNGVGSWISRVYLWFQAFFFTSFLQNFFNQLMVGAWLSVCLTWENVWWIWGQNLKLLCISHNAPWLEPILRTWLTQCL